MKIELHVPGGVLTLRDSRNNIPTKCIGFCGKFRELPNALSELLRVAKIVKAYKVKDSKPLLVDFLYRI